MFLLKGPHFDVIFVVVFVLPSIFVVLAVLSVLIVLTVLMLLVVLVIAFTRDLNAKTYFRIFIAK